MFFVHVIASLGFARVQFTNQSLAITNSVLNHSHQFLYIATMKHTSIIVSVGLMTNQQTHLSVYSSSLSSTPTAFYCRLPTTYTPGVAEAVQPPPSAVITLHCFSRKKASPPTAVLIEPKKAQCSCCLMLCTSHPEDDQSAVFLNAGFLTSTVLEGMRQIILRWWEREGEWDWESVCAWLIVC